MDSSPWPHNGSLLIDTDVGHDDVMAIAMLLAAGVEIEGITIVNGLAHVENGAAIILRLLDLTGHRDIPVFIGAEAPLAGDHSFETPWRVKADSMEGISLPSTGLRTAQMPAAAFLAQRVASNPGNITLLCLGPLTNIAAALREYGQVFARGIKQLVMMGGAIDVSGNETPNEVSEWNLYVDPRAAAEVISSGIPVVMVGLDATNDAPCTEDLLAELCKESAPQPAGRIIQQAMRCMLDSYLYDPVAAAYILEPALLRTQQLKVRVIAEGANAGQVVRDRDGTVIDAALSLDLPPFHQLLYACIFR